MSHPVSQYAGLIYHGGAWWVTSVRGADVGEVMTGLRQLEGLDPGTPPRNLRAIAWTDEREAAYQDGLRRGALTVITLREPVKTEFR